MTPAFWFDWTKQYQTFYNFIFHFFFFFFFFVFWFASSNLKGNMSRFWKFCKCVMDLKLDSCRFNMWKKFWNWFYSFWVFVLWFFHPNISLKTIPKKNKTLAMSDGKVIQLLIGQAWAMLPFFYWRELNMVITLTSRIVLNGRFWLANLDEKFVCF